MKVSIYKSVNDSRHMRAMPVDVVLRGIAAPPAPRIAAVAAARAAADDDARLAAKKLLPGVIWRGVCGGKRRDGLTARSGYAYIDIDPKRGGDSAVLRDRMGGMPWCKAAWVSAGGRGVGLLVLDGGVMTCAELARRGVGRRVQGGRWLSAPHAGELLESRPRHHHQRQPCSDVRQARAEARRPSCGQDG